MCDSEQSCCVTLQSGAKMVKREADPMINFQQHSHVAQKNKLETN